MAPLSSPKVEKKIQHVDESMSSVGGYDDFRPRSYMFVQLMAPLQKC